MKEITSKKVTEEKIENICKNTICCIETIYYTLDFENLEWHEDSKEMLELRNSFDETKKMAMETDLFIEFKNGEIIQPQSFSVMKGYPYQFDYKKDDRVLFRMFFSYKQKNLRPCYVMIASEYLWTHNIDFITKKVGEVALYTLEHVTNVLNGCDVFVKDVEMSRFDFAHHTTLIQDLDDYIPYYDTLKRVVTRLKLGARYPYKKDSLNLGTETIYFGRAPLKIRFYDKTREVFSQHYKGFFINLWHREGLINDYEFKILDAAYNSGIRDYDHAVMYAIIQDIIDEFKFIVNIEDDVSKKLKKILGKWQKQYKQGVYSKKTFNRILDFLEENYKRKYMLPRRVYNVELEVHRAFIDKILKNEYAKCFETTIDEEENKSSKQDFEELYDKFQSDVFDKEIFKLNNFLKRAFKIKEKIMQDVFRVINPDSNVRKTRCEVDEIYDEIRKTQIIYLDYIPQDLSTIVRKEVRNYDKNKNAKNAIKSLMNFGALNKTMFYKGQLENGFNKDEARELLKYNVEQAFDVCISENMLQTQKSFEERYKLFKKIEKDRIRKRKKKKIANIKSYDLLKNIKIKKCYQKDPTPFDNLLQITFYNYKK